MFLLSQKAMSGSIRERTSLQDKELGRVQNTAGTLCAMALDIGLKIL
jgi:hypothetical protein